MEDGLVKIAEELGAKGKICYQDEPLGTAHAILCAGDTISGHIIIAFADTLFKTDIKIDTNNDGIIWVNKVDNWKNFGVIELNNEGFITNFVEKPDHFVSDLAIIGVYYMKDGELLRKEMQYLIDNNIKEKGEYQFCLLYTSDAADERSSVDLGGRRIINKKKRTKKEKKKKNRR